MQESPKKIKVLYAITKGNFGGAQQYVYDLATGIDRARFEAVVVCGAGDALPNKLQTAGIRTIGIPTLVRDIGVLQEIKSFFHLLTIVRKEKPDVLHLNSSKIGLLGGVIGRILGVPKIIFTGHAWPSNEKRPWLIRKFFYILQCTSVLLSHTTICVSKKTQYDISHISAVKNKTVIIYNGVGSIDFYEKNEARNMLASKINGTLSPVVIGTLSELHTNKGLDILIDACQNIPDTVSVLILGDGERKDELQTQINSLGLSQKIHLLGRVEDAKRYLKAFDIFTLTSRTEALPYVILEAGLAGCAIVASRVGGIPEIIENEKNGILVRPDQKEIWSALEHLLQKPELREALGQRAKETIEKYFSQKEMIEKTSALYTR